MVIEELDKPSGQWCRHVVQGRGCGIHGSHPDGCRAFRCEWLANPILPHKLRPDQTKVVIAADSDGQRLIAYCDPANPLAWKRPLVRDFLRLQARETWGTGRTVMVKAGRRTWFIAPGEDIDLGEIDPRSPFRIVTAADGQVTVEVLPPVGADEDMRAAVARLNAPGP